MTSPGFAPSQGEVLDRMTAAERHGRILDRALPFLGRRVLDVGAGIGAFGAALAHSLPDGPLDRALQRERLVARRS